MTHPAHAHKPRRRDLIVAFSAGAVAASMVGMAYAAVPLYDWFCRTTGFGGTTQVSSAAPGTMLDRMVTVRFDANVGAGLPWRFEPEVRSIKARLGEVVTVDYVVTNMAARETSGIAGYNVAPLNVGAFFHKITCFCFTDQQMKAGERRTMPVVFYVDPAMAQDPDARASIRSRCLTASIRSASPSNRLQRNRWPPMPRPVVPAGFDFLARFARLTGIPARRRANEDESDGRRRH